MLTHRNVAFSVFKQNSLFCSLLMYPKFYLGRQHKVLYIENQYVYIALNADVCVLVRDLSIFSMVSQEINGQVRAYVSTLAWRKRMINESFHHSTSLKRTFIFGHYKDLSKRCFGAFIPYCWHIVMTICWHVWTERTGKKKKMYFVLKFYFYFSIQVCCLKGVPCCSQQRKG